MSAVHPLRRLLGFARPYRRDAALGALFSVLNKFFDVLPELLIGVAVDVVVNQKDSFPGSRSASIDPLQQLYAAGRDRPWWSGSASRCSSTCTRCAGAASRRTCSTSCARRPTAHLQALPPAFIERERSGRLMALLNEDVNQIERFLNTGANDLIQVFVSSLLVGAVFFVLTADAGGAGAAADPADPHRRLLVPAPPVRRATPRRARRRRRSRRASTTTSPAWPPSRPTRAEAFEAAHLRGASDAFRGRNAEAIRFSAAITPVIRMAILAGFVATLLYGGILALRGELGVGSYSALVYLTQRLLWPLTRLADMTDLYQRAMASVNRVMDLLDTPAAGARPRRCPGTSLQASGRFRDAVLCLRRPPAGARGLLPIRPDRRSPWWAAPAAARARC